ncbi:MAG: hypothetical protein IJW31_00005, partial [Lentisphaeria bacterium]|nr:hypothetical protein [Lentisphaeria bacterium]
LRMHPPSPKVMEDRGIMNYGRCRSFGATTFEPERLVDWMLRRTFVPLCMTLVEFCFGDRDNPFG